MSPDLDMFEMHGVWHESTDVLVAHVMGREALTVVVPGDVPDESLKAVAEEVRKGVRLARI